MPSTSPKRHFFNLLSVLLAALVAVGPLHASEGAEKADLSAKTPSVDTAGAETSELRLARIGYRLAKANADQCEHPEMLTGMILHDLGAYDRGDRAIIVKALGLRNGFGVRALIPGSSADLAGVRAGDEIRAVNGSDLDAFLPELIGKRASYDRTEAFIAFLDEALQHGPAALTVQRGDRSMSIRLSGEAGCGGRFTVLPGKALNAWSDGQYVAVTSRMMDFASSDPELAFVVGHEMAHNILKHAKDVNKTAQLFAQFGIGASRVKKTEIAADALAVTLLAHAGYDLAAPARILKRASKGRWFDLALTHPGTTHRIELIEGAIAQLDE